MERIERIRNHPEFVKQMRAISHDERDRVYCGHDMKHLLDVARILYIRNLEEGLGIEKEIIYAAALLHDIGRHLEYEKKEPHHEAGARLAEEIMADCGFSKEECSLVSEAILSHRRKGEEEWSLSSLLYDADKKSRACYDCRARETCKWPEQKMNLEISI